jgi:hypothetical protein
MGMTDATQAASLRRELAAMLGAALAIAAVLAVVSGVVIAPLIDPLPTVPPPPLLVVPWVPFALAGVLVAAATVAGARLTAGRVRRVELGEVMRVAE